MIVLGLDTTTMTGGAALVDEQGLIGSYVLNVRSTHSERLLPAVVQILADAELTLEDLDGVAVALGPGSFTGLRIGVATAAGFAYALSKHLVGVTTLEALAWQFQSFPGLICPLIDARRSEVYAQVFQGLEPLTPPLNQPIGEVLATACSFAQPVLFAGDGAVVHQETIRRWGEAVLPAREARTLQAASVAGLGQKLLAAGKTTNPLALKPFYLRKSEAEMRWKSSCK